MRVLVNFQHRDGWSIHCLEPDCSTPIGQPVTVATDEMLIRLLKASGPLSPFGRVILAWP
jgi:hypothetical protein